MKENVKIEMMPEEACNEIKSSIKHIIKVVYKNNQTTFCDIICTNSLDEIKNLENQLGEIQLSLKKYIKGMLHE